MTLLPVFMLSNDPRSFYFLNVVLSFVSLAFLYLAAQKITRHQLATFLVCFLFVTSYQVYWVPSLAMAENLFLPFFLATIWLLLQKELKLWHLVGISLLAGLQYGTKFVGLPLMTAFVGVTGLRVLASHISHRQLGMTAQKIGALVIPAGLLFLAFGGWSTISTVVDFAGLFVPPTQVASVEAVPTTPSAQIATASADSTISGQLAQTEGDDGWFESAYFAQNIKTYAGVLIGKPTRFLWDNTPLFPWWIALLAGVGLVYGLVKIQWRWLTLTLITAVTLQLVLLSFFYSTDVRYVYTILPTGMVGLALGLAALFELQQQRLKKLPLAVVYLVLLAILGVYSGLNFARLKLQAGLNLKYTETPWYFVAVNELNTFISNNGSNSTHKPVVITAMAPFFIDFYSTGEYTLLPLNEQQDFRDQKQQVWGIPNDQNLVQLYQQKLDAGYPVYVATYGIGNEKPLQASYSEVEKNFTLTKVHSGCHDLCNVFELGTKSAQPGN
jgi:hypothetical protein